MRDEALRDRDRRLEMAAQAHREGELARLEVEESQVRVGVAPDDGLRVRLGHGLDLDAALGRAHEQDAPLRAVEDRGEIELLDDVRGGPDQDLAHGHALDVHAEDRLGHGRRLVRGARELDAAGLASAADQDLGLDDDLVGAPGEEALGGGTGLLDGVGDGPGRDRQALGDEQRLGVGFLDLHAGARSVWWGSRRGGDGTASERGGGTHDGAGRLARPPRRRPATIGACPTASP